ncbi:MAG: hypothetical protein ACOZBW_03700 [Thermodesulfobacteriota bacterium]
MFNTSASLKMIFLAVLLVLSSTHAWAAQEPPEAPDLIRTVTHYKTASPDNARYEVIQSETAPRWLFKLDRYTGQVYQLTQTSKGEIHWIEMLVWERPEIKKPAMARFQLFISGFSAAYAILMDTAEGGSWILQVRQVKNKDSGESMDVTGWFPITALP